MTVVEPAVESGAGMMVRVQGGTFLMGSDMIGNVWEWPTDWYVPRHSDKAANPCCVARNPPGAPIATSYDPELPNVRIPRRW
jgi:formylglycine-generating enzyme required for sulfatase activity